MPFNCELERNPPLLLLFCCIFELFALLSGIFIVSLVLLLFEMELEDFGFVQGGFLKMSYFGVKNGHLRPFLGKNT